MARVRKKMKIEKHGSRPQTTPSTDYFFGNVLQDPIIEAPEPARTRSLKVSFEAGARTAWHTHPLGQTLFILSGLGLIGLRHQNPKFMKPGDSIWIPPHEEHWHGAAPDSSMVHIAIQEALKGQVTEWLEHVSDENYLRMPDE